MKIKSHKIYKIIAIALCWSMLFEQTGFAQVATVELNLANRFASFNNTLSIDKFRPLHLRYLQYDPKFNYLKLLLDKGSSKDLSNAVIEDSSKILLNYFLIGISLPNNSFWVNLRPSSPDNMIDPLLGQTDLGKILLEADVQLKKDTASFTSPETPEGKEYWDKLYQKAQELYGNQNATIPTLTRPWIVPNEIILRESSDNAYIYKATLKVMLEEDYLKDSTVYSFTDARQKQLNAYASSILREKIIPKLTREVNTAKRYAPLRQVYYSLILAQWFKQKFKGQGGLYANLIDKKNLDNLTSKAAWSKETYFAQYQKSFKDGEYNLKVSVTTSAGPVVRNYYSGGCAFENIDAAMFRVKNKVTGFIKNEDGFLGLFRNKYFKPVQVKNGQVKVEEGESIVTTEQVQAKVAAVKEIIFSNVLDADKETALTDLIDSSDVDNRIVAEVLEEIIRAGSSQISSVFKIYTMGILGEMVSPEGISKKVTPRESPAFQQSVANLSAEYANSPSYLYGLVASKDAGVDLKDASIALMKSTLSHSDNQQVAEVLVKIIRAEEINIAFRKSALSVLRGAVYYNFSSAILEMKGITNYLKQLILSSTSANISFALDAVKGLQAAAAINSQEAVDALKELVNSRNLNLTLKREVISALRFAANDYSRDKAMQALRELQKALKGILLLKSSDDEIKLEAIKALNESQQDLGFWSEFFIAQKMVKDSERASVELNLKRCFKVISQKDAVADFILALLNHKKASLVENYYSLLLKTAADVVEDFDINGIYGDNIGSIVTALIAKDHWAEYAAQLLILIKELKEIKPLVAPTTAEERRQAKASRLVSISTLLYFLLDLPIDLTMVKIVTKFLILDNREIILDEKLNLIMSNRWLLEEEGILEYLSGRYEQLPSDARLTWLKSMGNIIHADAMNSEDSLAEWEIFFNDYVPKFGFLASRAVILIDRGFYNHQNINSPELAEYDLAALKITNIDGLAKYVRRVKTKLFKNKDINEQDLENPIYYEIVSGIIGFNKGAWGGYFQGQDLAIIVQTVHKFIAENKLPPNLLTELEQIPDGSFQIRKYTDEISFTEEANKIFKNYQILIAQTLELKDKYNSNLSMIAVMLKGQILEMLNELAAQNKEKLDQLNSRSGSYYDNLGKVAQERKIDLELILENSKSDLSKRLPNLERANIIASNSDSILELVLALVENLKGKDLEAFQNIVTRALLIETFVYSPHTGKALTRVSGLGKELSVEFIDQLSTFKNDFLSEHVLAKDNIKNAAILSRMQTSRKEILKLFKIPSFNLALAQEKIKAQKEKAPKKARKKDDAPAKIRAFFDTRILLAVSGSIADACTTKLDLEIMTHPALIGAVIFAQGAGAKEEFVGSGLILKNQVFDNGRWENAWILRATNPTEELMGAYNADDFLQGYIKYVETLAQAYNQDHPLAPIKHILMPSADTHAMSNRNAIQRSAEALTENKEFMHLRESDNFNEYEIKLSCKEVSTVAPTPVEAGPKLLAAHNSEVKEQAETMTTQLENVGGIDFNDLQMIKQSGELMAGGGFNQGIINAKNFVPDKEWQEIERVLSASIMPSGARIKEYLINSCSGADCQIKINLALGGIAEILRMEEEGSEPTAPGLKELLALVESSQSAQQLRVALAKI